MGNYKMPPSPNQVALDAYNKGIEDGSTLQQLIDEWNEAQRNNRMSISRVPLDQTHPLWKRIEFEIDRKARRHYNDTGDKETMVSASFISIKRIAVLLTANGSLIDAWHFTYRDARHNKIQFDSPIMGTQGHYYDEVYDDWIDNKYFKDISEQFIVLGEI